MQRHEGGGPVADPCFELLNTPASAGPGPPCSHHARSSQVPEKARHYGIATGLPETVDPAAGLVLQYDLKISDGITCGGAYLKFLTADADIKFEELKDDSPYTVMFGPDKCGSTNKVRVALILITHGLHVGLERQWRDICVLAVSAFSITSPSASLCSN